MFMLINLVGVPPERCATAKQQNVARFRDFQQIEVQIRCAGVLRD